MKKIIAILITLSVVAAASVTSFFIVKNKKDKEKQALIDAANENKIFNFDSASINSLSLECDDGKYSIGLEEEDWIITDGPEPDFDLEQVYIDTIVQYMSTLTADENFGDVTEENKAMYGLDDPDVITVSDGTNNYTVYVGDQSPTKNYYYIMAEGKSKVYAIPILEGSVFKTSRMMMKSKSLVPYSDDKIHGIKLVKNNKTVYDLSYDANELKWKLPEKFSSLTIDQTNVTSMINIITRIDAQTMLDEHLEDYSKYGFDKPCAEIVFTGSDGSQRKLLFSYFGNDTNKYTHVLYTETGQVATFYTGDVDFIEKTAKDFVLKYAYNVVTSKINGLKLESDTINCDFNINQSETDFKVNDQKIPADNDDILQAYYDFYNSIIFMPVENVDVDINPEYTKPAVSITYSYIEDGKKDLIELVPAKDNNYYMFLNGKYIGVTVNEEYFIGKYSVTYFYNELSELINLD